jgi:cytochrome oxidase Cu insertion factor (SCO1/SenC/PrrC family)
MRGRRTALYGLVFSVLTAGLPLAPAAPADDALDDLLTAFQLTPLGDQKPTPFTLDSIEGKPVSLDTVRGKAVLLYFWESG